MPDRPELPTFFTHRTSTYDVMPDDKPMTWSIWDLDGCIGDITLGEGSWSAMHNHQTDSIGPFDTWQESVVGLLSSRPAQLP